MIGPLAGRPLYLEPAIRAQKQVADRTAEQIGDPPLRQMMRAIMEHVAALTEAAQVAQPVVVRTAGVGTADVDHHVIVLRRELPDLGSLALRPAG